MHSHRLSLAVILLAFSLPVSAQEKAHQEVEVDRAEPRPAPELQERKGQLDAKQSQTNLQAIENRRAKLRTAIGELDALIRRERRADLDARQRAEWNEQTKWLESVRNRYQEMQTAYSSPRQRAGTADMARLNAQFLALQNAVQMESRKYQTLSNASKARHDVAMKSIQNTRA